MSTKTPQKPRSKKPSAVITYDEVHIAEALDLVPTLSDAHKEQALRILLHPDGQAALRWREFAATNPTNAELRERLVQLWRLGEKRDQPLCCASAVTGNPLVFFGQDHVRGTPSLSGDELYDAVRKVLRMPPAVDDEPNFQELKRKGKSQAKPVPAAEPEDPMAGIVVVEERDVEFSKIIRSKDNPRQTFDQNLIEKMAPNIVTICQITPLTVREGSFELIDGETRHRAAELAKAKALRCKIIRCSDAQAATMRLLSAVDRQDLNPIERAEAIHELQQKHGYSQRKLADLVKLEQGSISNLTRLLELPIEWKEKVISKEITASEARELVPWISEPAVLKEVARRMKSDGSDFHLSRVLNQVLFQVSQPLNNPHYWAGTRSISIKLKPSDELRIHKVKGEQRCFNVSLWQKMVNELVKAAAARDRKREESGSGKADPQKAAQNAKKQKEMLARKLYKFRTAWYQAMIVADLEDAADCDLIALLMFLSSGHGVSERRQFLVQNVPLGKERSKFTYHGGADSMQVLSGLMAVSQKDEFQIGTLLAKLVKSQLSSKFDGFNNVVDPDEYELLAKHFDIDIKRDWQISFEDGGCCVHLWDAFCDLWNRDQILELLKEWKIENTAGPSAKRGELAKLLVPTKGCPKAILNAEAVRLS